MMLKHLSSIVFNGNMSISHMSKDSSLRNTYVACNLKHCYRLTSIPDLYEAQWYGKVCNNNLTESPSIYKQICYPCIFINENVAPRNV